MCLLRASREENEAITTTGNGNGTASGSGKCGEEGGGGGWSEEWTNDNRIFLIAVGGRLVSACHLKWMTST